MKKEKKDNNKWTKPLSQEKRKEKKAEDEVTKPKTKRTLKVNTKKVFLHQRE